MAQPENLLEELDALQDQVLRDLDLLDERILTLIRQCGQPHGLPPAIASLPPPDQAKTAA
jgi:hypothetical protein